MNDQLKRIASIDPSSNNKFGIYFHLYIFKANPHNFESSANAQHAEITLSSSAMRKSEKWLRFKFYTLLFLLLWLQWFGFCFLRLNFYAVAYKCTVMTDCI